MKARLLFLLLPLLLCACHQAVSNAEGPAPTVLPSPTAIASPEPTLAPTPEPSPEPTPEPILLAGVPLTGEEKELDLSELTPAEIPAWIDTLSRLPQVQLVCLDTAEGDSPWTPEQAGALVVRYPDLIVQYTVSAFGVTFSLADKVVSFNKIDLKDRMDELRALLPSMAHVGRLDMEYCNIPDEQMAQLRAEFPTPKIVWRVDVGRYSCRTDAIMIRFSDSVESMRLYSKDLLPLKYCPELRYVDLGHNHLSNADFAAYLPDLEVCIIAVEKELTDISALAACPKLEFLEIFNGKVSDLSALSSCKNLKHLNISMNRISDLSPLYELDLERLWLSRNPLSLADIEAFRRQFPNCQVDTNAERDPAATWRYKGKIIAPRYQLLRKQFCYDQLSINSYSAFNDPNNP